MRILVALSHNDLIDSFAGVWRGLAQRGHRLELAIANPRREDVAPNWVRDEPSITTIPCPRQRKDAWASSAPIARGLRDYLHYLDPRFAKASKLRLRTLRAVVRATTGDPKKKWATSECPVCGAELTGDHWHDLLSSLGTTERANLDRLLAQSEAAMPVDPSVRGWVRSRRPDVFVASSITAFEQSVPDLVQAARALGIPIVSPVVRWDALCAEGSIHVIPDRLLVWNQAQKDEACGLHGIPDHVVAVTGSPIFDEFVRRQATDRVKFCAPLALDTDRPLLTFLGSSKFVADTEPAFVERWVAAIRASNHPTLRSCNIVVRPHPSHPAYSGRAIATQLGVAVVGTDQQDLFDSLTHGVGAVGISTGSFVESGLLGTPARTLIVPEFDHAQRQTIHFQRLLRGHGGWVDLDASLDLHVARLAQLIERHEEDPEGREVAERFAWGSQGPGAAARVIEEIEAAGRGCYGRRMRGLADRVRRGTARPAISIMPIRRDVAGIPTAGATIGETGQGADSGPDLSAPSIVMASLSRKDLSWIGQDETTSEFWKGQLEAARVRAANRSPRSDPTVADVVDALGYRFDALPQHIQIDEDPEFMAVMTAWQRMKPLLRRSDSKAPGLTLDQWEHLSAIAWLEREQLLDPYLEFIRPFRIKSSMEAARHYYRTRVIGELCRRHSKTSGLSVIEIGAGAGNLASFLVSTGLVQSYTIVDLPEMMLNAAVHLSQWNTADLHFDELPSEAPASGRPQVHLLRTTRIKELSGMSFDLLLNFNSFMEMNQATRDMYLGEMYRLARDGALLYNVNRRQERLPEPDGSLFDNNPLLYPYATTDEIIFWEDDPFDTAVRAWFGKRPSLAIGRAAVVRRERT